MSERWRVDGALPLECGGRAAIFAQGWPDIVPGNPLCMRVEALKPYTALPEKPFARRVLGRNTRPIDKEPLMVHAALRSLEALALEGGFVVALEVAEAIWARR